MSALIGTFLACAREKCPPLPPARQEAAESCVARVNMYGARLAVYPRPDCPWTELLHLRIFDGFEPGMTAQEAQKAQRPHRTGRNRLGDYVEFDRALGTVRVGFEDHGSTPLPVDRFWVVRAFPENRSPQAFLSHEVQEYLLADAERLELVVMNNCGYPAIEVILMNGEVEVLTWLDTPGSRIQAARGTADESQGGSSP